MHNSNTLLVAGTRRWAQAQAQAQAEPSSSRLLGIHRHFVGCHAPSAVTVQEAAWTRNAARGMFPRENPKKDIKEPVRGCAL